MRLSWQEYAIQLAHVAKLRSEDPYTQVGAVALASNHRVLGAAYNGLAPGKNVLPDFWEDRDARRPFMIHAETNLLSLCKQGEPYIVAITSTPCTSCAQALAAYGVKEVVYSQIYHNDPIGLDILKFYEIKLTHIPV